MMENNSHKTWKKISLPDAPNTVIYDAPKYDQILKIDRENEQDVSTTLDNYEYDYDSKLLTLLYAAEQILM